ncbi:MAG: hypothetical protein UHO63_07010 [Blautia sp.]|nr:hypothetical protein [Blautia sp.]
MDAEKNTRKLHTKDTAVLGAVEEFSSVCFIEITVCFLVFM